MKKLNLSVMAIILFVLAISIQFSYGQMRNREMCRGNNYKIMQEKLNLTDTQSEAVEELHFKHKSEMIDLKAALEQIKLEKNELLSKGNYTREGYLNKVNAINDAKKKMALAKANHRMDIYDLLNDEQRKTFDKMNCCKGNRRQMGRMKYRQMRDKL